MNQYTKRLGRATAASGVLNIFILSAILYFSASTGMPQSSRILATSSFSTRINLTPAENSLRNCTVETVTPFSGVTAPAQPMAPKVSEPEAEVKHNTKEPKGSGDIVPVVTESLVFEDFSSKEVEAAGTVRVPTAQERKEAFLLYLRDLITQNQKYPFRARNRGIEGTVILSLSIDIAGNLLSCEITDSSGSSTLDRAATRLLKEIFPVADPPGEYLFCSISVTYELQS